MRGRRREGASGSAERDMMKYAGSTARTSSISWPTIGFSAPRGTSVAGLSSVEAQEWTALVVPSNHLASKTAGEPQEP